MADDSITLRCPECDTYSGHFTSSPLPDGTIEISHSICGRSGTPASFHPGTPEFARVYNHQEGDDDESDALLLAAHSLAQGLSLQAWVDLAPHLTCAEAETVKAFLVAFIADRVGETFMQAHALGDDDETDLHYQGGQ